MNVYVVVHNANDLGMELRTCVVNALIFTQAAVASRS